MKKTNLSLNKFKIARINDFAKRKVLGGTNGFGDNDDTDNNTGDGIKKQSQNVDENTQCNDIK